MSDVLGPKQLEERGLSGMFGPSPTHDTEVKIMAIEFPNKAQPAGELYTPEEDVIETLPDGRTIQVAAKGVAVPMTPQLQAALDAPAAGPSEPKAKAEAAAEETTVDDTKEAPAPSEKKPQSGPSEKK